jgi:DNA-binding CsgD family transcriptional regulator
MLGHDPGMSLLEREAQLADLAAVLDRVRTEQAGAGCLIEGEAGIGKTSLLAHCRADATGFTVLSARGADAEQAYPFGVVLQLLRPLARAVATGDDRLLTGPAGRCRDLVHDGHLVPGTDPFELHHALYWLLANAAESGPLLVAVDDAHLADDASLDFLGFLSQRVWAHPIALVVCRRPGGKKDLLAPDVPVLPMPPLTVPGAEAFVRATLPAADDAFCRAVHEATGGNPFLLREVVDAVTARELAPVAANAERVRRIVPDRVRRMALLRLADLRAEDRRLVRACAVLGEESELRLAAALAELAPDPAAGALDRVVGARILQAERGRVGFVHPLVRAAVLGDIAAGSLGVLHARAAHLLRTDGAPVEAVANHLLHCAGNGDPAAVAVLRQAAESALAGGAEEAAAELLDRALAEGVPAARPGLELALAGAVAVTDPDRAERLVREAGAHGADPADAAEAVLGLARAHQTQGRMADAARLVGGVLADVEGYPRPLRLRLFAEYVSTAALSGSDLGDALTRTLTLVDEVDPATADVAELEATAAVALQLALGGHERQALRLAERALAGGRLIDLAGGGSPALSMCTGALHTGGEFARDLAVADLAMADARRRGSPAGFAMTSYIRATALYPQGRVEEAIADAEAAIAGAAEGWQQYLPAAYGYLALSLAERGAAAEGLARMAAITEAEWAGTPLFGIFLGVRGKVRLQAGQTAEALADFETWRRLWPVPSVCFWGEWRSSMSEALARLGRPTEGLALAEEELALLGADAPAYGVGRAQRARALCLAGTEQVAALEDALATLEATASHLDRIRTMVDLGAARRRTGRRTAARDVLRAAIGETERLGLIALHGRATEELEAAGGRPRRPMQTGPDSLTPSEARVARMAASGLSNREIAAALFVTPKAVSYHLGNVYRKLAVAGREQLAEHVG